MNLSNILPLFALLATSANAQSFVNGQNCDLTGEISCMLVESGEECKTYETFNKAICDTDPDFSIKAEYTFTYANEGQGTIKFLKGINPDSSKDNPFTFARANLIEANIQRGQNLAAGATREYTVSRTLKPCVPGGPRFRFVAELQMNGFIVGNKGDSDFSCSSRDFYTHKIQSYAEAITQAPTSAPTPAPTSVAPTLAPTPVPTSAPTLAPTPYPSLAPTASSTAAPTVAPNMTLYPTSSPTAAPTIASAPSGKGKGKGGKGSDKAGTIRRNHY